jgi:uncharacterized OB-fold protein
MATKPVVEGLFAETEHGPRLLGSRCTTCRTPYFPRSPVCHNPACAESRIEEAAFGPKGTIWSLAMQDYPPPAPVKFDAPYQRYAMAVVDLDDGLRVLGRIATDDPDAVRCDQPVEMVIDVLHHDAEGNAVTTWKFRPL